MPYVVVRKGCTFVLLLYYRSYWEFEEHSINFLGANNEKIYQLKTPICTCSIHYLI